MTIEKRLRSLLNRSFDKLIHEGEYLRKFSEEFHSELNYYIDEEDELDGVNVNSELQEIQNELFALTQKLETFKNRI